MNRVGARYIAVQRAARACVMLPFSVLCIYIYIYIYCLYIYIYNGILHIYTCMQIVTVTGIPDTGYELDAC